MYTPTPLMQQLDLTYPIIQAPMAGGATTPELVSAVSEAGGLGSIGAGMTAPEALAQQIAATKALTDKPFAVNLMVLSEAASTTFDAPMPQWLSQYYEAQGIDVNLPEQPAEKFDEQLAGLLAHPVAVASFTFGIITTEQVAALHAVGTMVVGTANHPLEAKAWADVGADAVCVQGMEAGGHRGGWLAESEQDPLGLLTLIAQTRQLTDVPLIAAGGIMTAGDIRTVLQAGAQAAQMGTVFLTTHESGINAIYKKALLDNAQAQPEQRRVTQLTRLFSGKLARGLVNDYMQTYARFDEPQQLPPYPQLNAMTKPLRAHAKSQENREYLSLWAGQGAPLVEALPVAKLMQKLGSGD